MSVMLNFSATERALAGLHSSRARPYCQIRVEHIKHSACRTDFLNRVKSNELEKKEAKKAGKEAPECKRRAKEPLGAHIVKTDGKEPEFLAPINYEFVA